MAESLPFYHLINSWLHRQKFPCDGLVLSGVCTTDTGILLDSYNLMYYLLWYEPPGVTPSSHTDNIYTDTDSLSHNDNQIKEKLFDSKFLQDKSTQVIFLQHQFTTYTIHVFLHSDLDPHNLKKTNTSWVDLFTCIIIYMYVILRWSLDFLKRLLLHVAVIP